MRPPKIVPLLVVLVLKRHVVKAFIYSKHATHNIHKGEGHSTRAWIQTRYSMRVMSDKHSLNRSMLSLGRWEGRGGGGEGHAYR